MVDEVGLEPTRPEDQLILSQLRLPITPLVRKEINRQFICHGHAQDHYCRWFFFNVETYNHYYQSPAQVYWILG